MATTRYSTSVSLCEDTSKNFELFDLLKQADPNYSAVDPARIKLYVYDGTKYVEATSGYFTAVDKDTFTVDATQLPNFNGELKVRVLGTDSTGMRAEQAATRGNLATREYEIGRAHV